VRLGQVPRRLQRAAAAVAVELEDGDRCSKLAEQRMADKVG
jgi:phosphopantothenate synthetase